MTPAELAHALQAEGLIPADAEPPGQESERPWFVSLLRGLCGWLAGLFLLGFVGVFFQPTDELHWYVVAAVCFVAAFGLYAKTQDSAFFDQFALALWIAAQVAVLVGLTDSLSSETLVAFIVTAMQVVLIFVTPNRFAKLLATLFACIAWSLTVRLALWGEHSLWSSRMSVPLVAALAGWLLGWIPSAVLAAMLVAKERVWIAGDARATFRPVLSGLLLSLSFGPVVSQPAVALQLWLNDAARVDNWLAIWPLLAAGAAVFALFTAFRLRHRGLMGAAMIGALLHIAQFYYTLGISLLMKSALMVGVGIALLILATVWTGAPEEQTP